MRVLGFIGGLDYPYERFFSPYDSREFMFDERKNCLFRAVTGVPVLLNTLINEIGSHVGGRWKTAISPQVFALIRESDGEKTLNELMESIHIKTEEQKCVLITELLNLWCLRLIRLTAPENGCRKEARIC